MLQLSFDTTVRISLYRSHRFPRCAVAVVCDAYAIRVLKGQRAPSRVVNGEELVDATSCGQGRGLSWHKC